MDQISNPSLYCSTMFVIASGMFGCLLTAVGCAFGDDKDPEESNEEPRV